MNSPLVSVIIPCYNQGSFLAESIGSVLASTMDDCEIIVVDDGSSDIETLRILDNLDYPRTRLLRTANNGLAAARNNGIAAATGRYILPLDADDRIAPGYLEKGSAVLDARPEVGIVYCLGELFGARSGPIAAPAYTLRRMLFSNLIFSCALFRRTDWEACGGYDPGMVHGCEDWDFWLSLIELGRQVVRLPEVLFCYRIREESMNLSMDRQKRLAMHRRILENHRKLFPWWAAPLLAPYHRLINSAPYAAMKRAGLLRKLV
jgi:glycosyltransferase involved in cell wall biosynthesis